MLVTNIIHLRSLKVSQCDVRPCMSCIAHMQTLF
jgi:hypothetical protein